MLNCSSHLSHLLSDAAAAPCDKAVLATNCDRTMSSQQDLQDISEHQEYRRAANHYCAHDPHELLVIHGHLRAVQPTARAGLSALIEQKTEEEDGVCSEFYAECPAQACFLGSSGIVSQVPNRHLDM